ncbi:membrane protein [Deinococcus aetherius]|uniref:Membrane protein n=1 Tax=Deinococcus aetherius TaxID=200252 RepID=A0ABN6RCV1_9DEIO|nr:DUF2892 domain-containing protein [Deinococcus aetherius]BDP41116.1 membrane protein [Deinococcus aetherius]
MTTNESITDRIIRAVLGMALLIAAFTLAGVWTWIGGIPGTVLVLTALTGFCPLYALLGISTHRAHK